MNTLSYILLLALPYLGCLDVVDVDLHETDTKLIFEAVLSYNEENLLEDHILVSTTGSFFNTIEADTLKPIQILNVSGGGVGFYLQDLTTFGNYVPGTDEGGPFNNPFFVAGHGNPDDTIFLTFEYLNELYGAFTRYTPVAVLDSVIQGENTLFDSDETEIIVSFTDSEAEENYYVFNYGDGAYVAIEDTFFNGQNYSLSYFSNHALLPGDQVPVRMWGVDKDFYTYMIQLIEQSALGENSFFQVPVTTVRGTILMLENIDTINLSNTVGRPQDFVLGYFAFVQERSRTLSI